MTTRYWPTFLLLRYAKLTDEQKREVMNAQNGLSMLTVAGCYTAACSTPACTSLALIGSRRVYTQEPTAEDWLSLERGGFMEIDGDFGFVMDALH